MTRFYLLVLSIIVLGIHAALVSGQCQGDQKALLLDLKGSLEFEEFASLKPSKLVTWHSSGDCCDWEGVSCDSDGLGHVIGLDLSEERISGWDPSGIFSLQHLRSLNLAFNGFSTSIPGQLANLTKLVYMNLSNSDFTGQIPIQLSKMANLVTLDLSGGDLLLLEKPNLRSLVKNFSKLTELYLDGISLSGDGNIDWCHALSTSLPNLQVLSLSGCQLSGPIDASLQNLKFLTTINLSGNNFSGPVLDTLLQVPSLETLDLSASEFNVSFPEIPQNKSLQNLLLSGTTISGGLPRSIGYLKNLSRMELAYCKLMGTLPWSMENLTQLVHLDLSSNQLTGVVPSFHRCKNLSNLDLSNNQLSGEIPSSYLQGLLNLSKVDLSKNRFTGSIPSSIFEIPSLQRIELSSNQFGGQIPEFPSAFASLLNSLDLADNKLVGPFPRSIFNLRRLGSLYLQHNKLNGSIQFDWFRKLANLTILDLSENTLTIEVTSTESNLSPFPQFTDLGLSSYNLTKFPDMGNQSALQTLDLSDNNILEVLPGLERLTNGTLYYLDLSFNLLKSLPDFTNFPVLDTLSASNNQLSSKFPLPPPFVTSVDYSHNNLNSSIPLDIGKIIINSMTFDLANNFLSGSIPESICATSLEFLDLSNNLLHGKIPACLMSGNGNLGVLNLRANRLRGTIPNNFRDGCGLLTLDLSNNVLQGKFPSTLANCTSLEALNLGNNQINDSFPCAMKISLPYLRVLILRNNQFHGKIGCPGIRGTWDMLRIMDIAQNQFNGVLPEAELIAWKTMMEGGHDEAHGSRATTSDPLAQYSTTVIGKGVRLNLTWIAPYFTSIDFSYNKFEGPLPEVIGKFRALYLLNLSHNSFSGPILPSVGNLSELESLDLSANNLSGAIPQQLSALSFLEFLNVSSNKLTGKIPKGTQIQTFPASSFEDNAGLCGLPLPQPCHHISEPTVPSSTEHEKAGKDWGFMVTAGLGFVMGVAAVIAPLIYDKNFNRWFDYHGNRIYMMLLSYFYKV